MRDGIGKGTRFHLKIPQSRYLKTEMKIFAWNATKTISYHYSLITHSWRSHQTYRVFLSKLLKNRSHPYNPTRWKPSRPNNTFFPQKEVVKSIGNPAGIGQGTGLGLRERERDGIGLGHYRLRARIKALKVLSFHGFSIHNIPYKHFWPLPLPLWPLLTY